MLRENRLTLILAAPIIAGQVGQMLMGWVDTMMIGHIGTVPLAGCTFANNLAMVFMVFGFGLLTSVPVFASRSHGAGEHAASRDALLAFHWDFGSRGIWSGLAAGLAVAAVLLTIRLWKRTRTAGLQSAAILRQIGN